MLTIQDIIKHATKTATNVNVHFRQVTTRIKHSHSITVSGDISFSRQFISVPVQVFNIETWSSSYSRVIIDRDSMAVNRVINDGFFKNLEHKPPTHHHRTNK